MRGSVSILAATALLLAGACSTKKSGETSEEMSSEQESTVEPEKTETESIESPDDRDQMEQRRKKMVEVQIAGRGVENPDVLAAMRKIPRHEFVPPKWRYRSYSDTPLPIGHDVTISQPFIVAKMTELLDVDPKDKILEIGTGSGYQAAVLAELGAEVYSIEIVCPLAEKADETLDDLGYENVAVKCGDGYKGWPEHAPFDRIIVTAAPPEIPEALVEQLASDGRLVVPVGSRHQNLQVVTKNSKGDVDTRNIFPVRFVPMVHGEEKDMN